MPCPQPRPTKFHLPLRADTFSIEEHRNVHCRFYGGCIDVAVRQDWESFTCAKCPLFQQDKAPGASSFAFTQPANFGQP
ncbi:MULTISPECIES: hypothetical protein [Corallococcus]|uniref:Uncharacterized protein n=1 Tax=Corallococcus coralloides (strain ATCC 25202 / DSM 2259 / NBRC 100086 / M2) TaxID=1144275 RepID=H8MHB1_CORCM|nr:MULTISPECIES: hypothetical protein [Corallococcus]NOJ98977.1 hypothetical protein [Corallococcus coralloides]AFE03644.1 hypothetical protein COCOR_00690 [Corallococcus coralloides DSM 2259]MBN9688514.1 hypothetical protein [Corallococcus sp. NCSPR001]RKG60930.1 hypothetical protein D7X30_08465 [Corallococcus sp. AB011P]RKG65935.1 hypothetical protein D7V80_21505 [Corallococcus sp. CA054B]